MDIFTQSAQISNIVGELNKACTVMKDSDQQKEAARLRAVSAAKDLVAKLENPAETILQHAFSGPDRVCVRLAIRLGIFHTLTKRNGLPIDATDLAATCGAEVLFIGEVYDASNDFDHAFQCFPKMPAYFEKNGYQCPTDPLVAPFQYAFDMDLSLFDYMEKDSKAFQDFDTFMTASRNCRPIFADWFPVQEQILNGYQCAAKDEDNVLLVDVGGGRGQDLETFTSRFPTAPGRLILQDLSRTVEHAKLSPRIEVMAYDFMKPQPIKGSVSLFSLVPPAIPYRSSSNSTFYKTLTMRGGGEPEPPAAGARTYFFHYILHNWPDHLARTILRNTAAAMKPSYSKIILNELILPAKDCPQSTSWADMHMMAGLAALERNEKQWLELLKGTGLKVVKFWFPMESIDGVIELMLEDEKGQGEGMTNGHS